MSEVKCPACKKQMQFEIENVKNQRFICCDKCGYASIENIYYEGEK